MFMQNGFTLPYSRKQWSPTFVAPGTSFKEEHLSMDCVGVGGFGIIQVHYIYRVLYFYYQYISFTSDHQALYPRG